MASLHLTGTTAAQGREGIKELLGTVAQDDGSRLPVDAHASLTVLAAQLQAVQTMIGSLEKRIVAQHRSNEASKRLETIPSVRRSEALAIFSSHASLFRSTRLATISSPTLFTKPPRPLPS